MKISRLIKELSALKRQHGDIEVTCSATTDGDSKDPYPALTGGVFESTAEHLKVLEPEGKWKEKRVRIFW
ncbi:MAG: hypothetical protein E6R03_04605 [Hyphomicrobiaceae bacterium]|nr:MAG: hypothetical protein E6R03_04605 [Hyphomicrobiaceae bacterium]